MTLVEYEHMQWVWFLLSWSLQSGGDAGEGVKDAGTLALNRCACGCLGRCAFGQEVLPVYLWVCWVYLWERAVCVWMVWVCKGNESML